MPSVFTLGKGFAECSTRQSPLGKLFLGKGSLPSALYPSTRQNKKKLPSAWGGTQQNIFRRCGAGRLRLFCRVPREKNTRQTPFAEKNFAERPLPSATLGKAFAECKNTRQSRGLQ